VSNTIGWKVVLFWIEFEFAHLLGFTRAKREEVFFHFLGYHLCSQSNLQHQYTPISPQSFRLFLSTLIPVFYDKIIPFAAVL